MFTAYLFICTSVHLLTLSGNINPTRMLAYANVHLALRIHLKTHTSHCVNSSAISTASTKIRN